ncbi:33726_t:CDS:2, partial [Gigaspora margarita]
MILKHTTFDENVLDKDCVNVRCVKNELMKSSDIDYVRKENRTISGIKEKSINRKGPEREYLAEIRKVNDENLKGYSQEADSGLNDELLEQQYSIRTLNCMLKTKHDMRSFIKLSDLSYQKVKVSSVSGKVNHLVFEDLVKAHREANVMGMEIQIL